MEKRHNADLAKSGKLCGMPLLVDLEADDFRSSTETGVMLEYILQEKVQNIERNEFELDLWR